jgi:hypothetical protein
MDILCIRQDCLKRAIYADGTKPPIYCSDHREDGMTLNSGGICLDCSLFAIFNHISESRPIYCKTHKKEGMVDVSHKKCEYGSCLRRPTYNFATETTAMYCSLHRDDGMINVVSNICIEHNCERIALYGLNTSSPPMYCSLHRKPNTFNVKGYCCQVDGCNKYSLYNNLWETTPLYCKDHMSDGMVDLRNKRCVEEDCIVASAIDGHCKGCHARLFSNNKMYQIHKFKEDTVFEFLKENYNDVEIEYNKNVNSYQSPIILHFPDRIVLIEVDYINGDREKERLLDLMGDLDTEEKAVYAIRLNPNGYYINGARQKSSWVFTNKFPYPLTIGPKWEKRLLRLKECIDFPENEIIYLYFDR